MTKISIALLCCALLSACATMPDVDVKYILANAKTTVSLTQTVSCLKDKKGNPTNKGLVFSYGAPTVTTAIFADKDLGGPGKGVQTLTLHDYDTSLSDVDFAVTLSDDGRLKGINVARTGEAETILKSAIALGTAVAVAGAGVGTWTTECDVMKKWGDGKAVSLTYTANLNPTSTNKVQLAVVVDQTSQRIYDALNINGNMPDIFVKATATDIPNAITVRGSYTHSLTLQTPVSTKLRIVEGELPDSSDNGTIYSSIVLVPGPTLYALPIPDNVSFGSAKMVLSLSDTGAINTLEYSKNTGAAGPLNVAGAVATAAQ